MRASSQLAHVEYIDGEEYAQTVARAHQLRSQAIQFGIRAMGSWFASLPEMILGLICGVPRSGLMPTLPQESAAGNLFGANMNGQYDERRN